MLNIAILVVFCQDRLLEHPVDCIAQNWHLSFLFSGTITKANELLFLQVYEFDEVMFPKNVRCPTCDLRKPARSKHCSKSGPGPSRSALTQQTAFSVGGCYIRLEAAIAGRDMTMVSLRYLRWSLVFSWAAFSSGSNSPSFARWLGLLPKRCFCGMLHLLTSVLAEPVLLGHAQDPGSLLSNRSVLWAA